MFTTIYLFFVMMFGGAEGVENAPNANGSDTEVGILVNGGGGCPGGSQSTCDDN